MNPQKQQRKAHFEALDYPTLDPPKREYYIYDAYGNKAELSPREVYDLLEWLYQHRDELYRLVHPELDERTKPVWLREVPEALFPPFMPATSMV